MSIQTSLGKKPFAQDVIENVLETLADDTRERISMALLTRMRRSYSLIVLDGQEYILVPSTKREAA